MRQKRINGCNIALLRQEAGEVLARDANRLRLIEAILVCATSLLPYAVAAAAWQTAVLPMLARDADHVRLLWYGAALWGFFALLTLFFTLPLFTGLLWMAAEMDAGEEAFLPDVFHAFTGGRAYRAALRISFGTLWRLCLFAVLEGGIYHLFLWLGNGSVWVALCSIPVLILAGAGLLYLFAGGFLRTYLRLCAPAGGARMRPYARSVGISFWLGFLPWLVLSLMTLCILLLADVLPRMLISYFRLCRKLNDLTTQSEE